MENKKKSKTDVIAFLQENMAFPCKISFLLIKEQGGSVRILSMSVKTKDTLENLKYKQVTETTWSTEGSAVLSVKEFTTAEEYLEEAERLKKMWGFALREVQDTGIHFS